VLKIPIPIIEWSLRVYSLQVGVWCGIPQQAIIGPISCRETVTALCTQKLLVIMTFITLLQLKNKTTGFNKMELLHIQQIQQYMGCTNSVVIALVLETCGILDFQI
jgi:hypothetical protein